MLPRVPTLSPHKQFLAWAMAAPELQGHSCPRASGGEESPHTLTRPGVPAWKLFPFDLMVLGPQPSSTSALPAVAWAVLEDVEPKRVSRRTAAKEETVSAKPAGSAGAVSRSPSGNGPTAGPGNMETQPCCQWCRSLSVPGVAAGPPLCSSRPMLPFLPVFAVPPHGT